MKKFSIFIIILFVFFIGCGSDSTEPLTEGQIYLYLKYSNSLLAFRQSAVPGASLDGIDSIKITRARFLVRDVKFKNQNDSVNVRSFPYILDLNMTGKYVGLWQIDVPFGVYKRIEFDIHRAVDADFSSLSESEKAIFNDFLAGDKYSILIDCTIYKQGQSQAYTYKSKLNMKRKVDATSDIIISNTYPYYNAALIFSSYEWFKSSPVTYIDPTDSNNETQIDANLRDAIFLQ